MSSPIRVDLHLHTTASDGVLSPTEIVRSASSAGMQCIAITDHDTVLSVADSIDEGLAYALPVIPGIELCVGESEEIHLLGYGLDYEDGRLLSLLDRLLLERQERMSAMLERLSKMGLTIPPSEIVGINPKFIGRSQLAHAMAARGHVKTAQEAFERYIGYGKPAYVPRNRMKTSEGIAMLCSYHAVVSLAHPGRLSMDRHALSMCMPGWIEAGLAGIEAYHPSHSFETAQYYDRLARNHHILVTGGSDFHGKGNDFAKIGDHLKYWKMVASDIQALKVRVSSPHYNR